MNAETSTPATAQTERIVKQLVDAWHLHNKRVTDLMNKYPDDVYLKPVAPGRNRVIYLFGHLIAVGDAMLPLLGLGERLYPQLDAPFVANADNPATDLPALSELKQQWEKVNATLTEHFNKLSPQDWFAKHTAVNDADFAANPSRNRLNVLISRTNHVNYHLGQMALVKA
jgi:hypothetical protein